MDVLGHKQHRRSSGSDTIDYSAQAQGMTVRLDQGTAQNAAATIVDHVTNVENARQRRRRHDLWQCRRQHPRRRGRLGFSLRPGRNDWLTGGNDVDVLTGGAGADLFKYRSTFESRAATSDAILDFSRARTGSTCRRSMPRQASSTRSNELSSSTARAPRRPRHLSYYFAGGATIVVADTDNNHANDLVLQLSGTLR